MGDQERQAPGGRQAKKKRAMLSSFLIWHILPQGLVPG
jgi:hypothetical protein